MSEAPGADVIRPILSDADVEEILAASARRPVILFKHSPSCGISRTALKQFQQFLADPGPGDALVALVRVVQERPQSRLLAERLGVTHQSPQVIFIRNGAAVWHESHSRITATELTKQAAAWAGA